MPVREVAAGRAHRFGQNHVGGQFVAPAPEILERTAGMGRVDAAGKEPAGLHHLMAGIVHGSRRVITSADERELVRNPGVQGKDLGKLDVRIVGPDRLERPADLARRLRLHIPGVQLAWSAEIEDHYHRFLIVAFAHGPHGL